MERHMAVIYVQRLVGGEAHSAPAFLHLLRFSVRDAVVLPIILISFFLTSLLRVALIIKFTP